MHWSEITACLLQESSPCVLKLNRCGAFIVLLAEQVFSLIGRNILLWFLVYHYYWFGATFYDTHRESKQVLQDFIKKFQPGVDLVWSKVIKDAKIENV